MDILLAAFLGFVVGVIWQEIHFSKVTRALEEAVARMNRLEGR